MPGGEHAVEHHLIVRGGFAASGQLPGAAAQSQAVADEPDELLPAVQFGNRRQQQHRRDAANAVHRGTVSAVPAGRNCPERATVLSTLRGMSTTEPGTLSR